MKQMTNLLLIGTLLVGAGCAVHGYKSPDGASLISGSLFMKRANVDLQRSTNGTARARITGSQVDGEALGAVTEAAVRAAVKSVAP